MRRTFALAVMLAAAASGTADTLVLPPYLELVVFDIFRGAPDGTVEIFAPHESTPLRPGAGGVESFRIGDVMGTLVVPRPPPGEWTIRCSHRAARVRVLSQRFFPRGALVTPQPGDALRQYDRVALAYRITDGNGQPLRELAGYTLSADISLLRPDGSVRAIATRREPGGFRSTSDAECDLAGRYWTDVRLTTTDARGRRLEVFRDRWSGFSVSPGKRVDPRPPAWPYLAAMAAICCIGAAALKMRRR